MPVPNTFGTATSAIPLSQLDANFATPITIGNTAVQLGNTVTTLNNMTLANVTISSGTITITNVAVTTANVSGTANISTLVVVGNATVGGNTTITGNITAANANVTTNLVLSGGTANGVAYLNTSKVLTTGSALTFDGTNLGIGLTNPGAKLDAYQEARVSFANSNQYYFSIKNTSGNPSLDANGSAAYLSFGTTNIGDTLATERMRISSATGGVGAVGIGYTSLTSVGNNGLAVLGNVGIGTSSPVTNLSIGNGGGGNDLGVFLSRGATSNFYQSYDGTKTFIAGVDSANDFVKIGSLNSHPIGFVTNNSEKVRIDTSGNLLVGQTSQGTIGSNSSFGAYSSGYIGVSSTGDSVFSRRSTDGDVITFRRDTTSVGSIAVTTVLTTYNTTSDYRLKNITGTLTGAKDFIMALQPKQGTWKADGSKFVGFLAHEFQEVSPSSVIGKKDAVDADGKPIMQSMQASSAEVMANLVAFVQELKAEIDSLKSQLNGA